MRIAVDARELCGRSTGVGQYLAHLLDAWERLPEASAHDFVLYAPERDDALRQCGGAAAPARRAWRFTPPVGLGRGTPWEQILLPLALVRDRPDVLFSPAYTAPALAPVPVVVTIHDLSFVAHPEWFPPRSRVRRRLLTAIAARRARAVLAVSEFSRGEVVRLLGVPAGKVKAIPLGGPGRAAVGAAPHPRPVVLFVGSVFNRRHLPELVRAFALVRSRHPETRLEIVGDDRTYPPIDLQAEAARAGVADATTIHSYVPDETIDELYGQAGVFAFLSDYEGFGLTPLEAMRAGVPALVGDTPAAREVYGDAVLFVGTTDVPSIADRLERLLFSAEARAALLERAPAVLGRYSWERAARETLAAIVEAADA
jgi:glycosyltransferase involved in cell wall biosynthesis